jgi:hypothetical protein
VLDEIEHQNEGESMRNQVLSLVDERDSPAMALARDAPRVCRRLDAEAPPPPVRREPEVRAIPTADIEHRQPRAPLLESIKNARD